MPRSLSHTAFALLLLVLFGGTSCRGTGSPTGGTSPGTPANPQQAGSTNRPADPDPKSGTQGERREWTVTFTRLSGGDVEFVAVPRSVSAEAPAEEVLRKLLDGPTQEEREQGLTSQIPEGTRLEKLTVKDGTAHAAFSEELDKDVAGSMRVTTIREQIERTLLQFPTVERVVIEVDGRVDDVLQP